MEKGRARIVLIMGIIEELQILKEKIKRLEDLKSTLEVDETLEGIQVVTLEAVTV